MALRENRITVSFPEVTKKQLEEEAARRGWNMSQLVREIVKDYFAGMAITPPQNRMLNQDINYFK